MNIKNFNSFISENLGIVHGLEEIAKVIIDNLSKSKYFEYKFQWNGEHVTLFCIFDLNIKNDGSFIVDSFEERTFTLKLKYLDKNLIIHELKHLDRSISLGTINNKHSSFDILDHLMEIQIPRYEHLFKLKNGPYILTNIIYLSNPNEFESYFNQYYHILKDMITNDMSKSEKIKIIDDFLKNTQIFVIYQYYYKNKFDINLFFKDELSTNEFFKKLRDIFDSFNSNKKITLSKSEIFFNRIKRIFTNKKNIKLDSEVKNINNMVNNSIMKNYKKFSRLYTLLT